MISWIIPCNPKVFNVFSAFKSLGEIDWKQTTNVKPNDIVYIYVGKNIGRIAFKCIATKCDMEYLEIDDSEFLLNKEGFRKKGRFMRLKVLNTFESQKLSLHALQKNGLTTVRGATKISAKLYEYIKEVEGEIETIELEEKEDFDLLKDLATSSFDTKKKHEHFGKPKEKPEKILSAGSAKYPRSRQTSINALAYANFSCEINPQHLSFIRKNVNCMYTEPHHLVPMAYSDQFDISLDVEENIVSLCSNCHNNIHYGRDAQILLQKLYFERKKALENVGIKISLEELLELYGY